MGFWGSLGKGLMKVAPIAAAFIPGVGPLASMAISAGTSALAKKASGGSWKSALGAGALGAAGGLGAAGLGPTGSRLSKITGNVGKVMGTGSSGWQGALGGALKGGLGMMNQPQMQPQMTQAPSSVPYQMPDSTVASDPLGQRRRQGGLAPSFARGAAMAS